MSNEAVGNDSPSLRIGSTPPIHKRALSNRRWVRMAFEPGYDAISWICGLLAAAWMTRDLARTQNSPFMLLRDIAAVCLLSAAAGLLAGLYRGRHQRGSLDEVMGVGMATCVMGLFLALVGPRLVAGQHAAFQAVAGSAMFALLAMLGARYVLFAVNQRVRRSAMATVKVIVFGAGDAGSMLIWRLNREPNSAYRPVAVLDDDPAKRRLRIQGVPVLGDRTRMSEVAASSGATVLVIAIARASGTAIRDLTAQAESCGLIPKVVPSVSELLTGGARIEGVRDPRISDLLGRRPVRTDVAAVAGYFSGKRILVTGAGGSIGSELCRQLHRFDPAELILLDRDESALHSIQLALHGRALLDSDETILADIRDPQRIREVFDQFRPQIVFHAAALKHLPLLERYPAEAVKSNILGTWNVLEAAADWESIPRQHLDGQGRRPGERAGLLQADHRAPHRAHGRPGPWQLSECPVRQRAGQPRLGAHRPVRASRRGRTCHRDPSRGDPLLHDGGRGRPTRPAGGSDRVERRSPRPGHGRARADRRHSPTACRRRDASRRHRVHRAAARRKAGRGLAGQGRSRHPAPPPANPPCPGKPVGAGTPRRPQHGGQSRCPARSSG